MYFNRSPKTSRISFLSHFMASTSVAAMALAGVLTSAKADTPFSTMVGMQAGKIITSTGQVAQWSGANAPVIGTDTDGRPLMSIEQTQQKALLDWEDFRLKTNEVLEFKQQSSDWLVVNRVHGNQAAEVNGEIRAIGSVYIFNDNGVLIGDDAVVNTRTLVTGSGVSDVNVDGKTTTLVQSAQKASLTWSSLNLETDQVLKFQQDASNWIAVNKVTGGSTSSIDGTVSAEGVVSILNDNGVTLGANLVVDAGRLITGRGVSDITIDGSTMTIVQSAEKASLDWSDMSLGSGDTLRVQQEDADWILLNRSYGTSVTHIDGTLEADGNIYLVAPAGISVDGAITAQQVILSSLYMPDDQFYGTYGLVSYARDYNNRRDPTFSNTWIYESTGSANDYLKLLDDGPEVVDADDPLHYNVTVGRTGTITTGDQGKIMLFGPNVTNKGILSVQDEGQVILAAGENIYLETASNGMFDVHVGAYNPLTFMRANISYRRPPQTASTEEWAALYSDLLGRTVAVGEKLSSSDYSKLYSNATIDGVYVYGGLIGKKLNDLQTARANEVGYSARNEGIIYATGGGSVDFRGWNLEQMGSIEMTSTALFRGNIDFRAAVWDYWEFSNGDSDGSEYAASGNGAVVFGKGSLTQITPDLDSTDTISLTSGSQSVGSLKINARTVDMQENSLIYMPSGTMNVLLDAGKHVFDNNRGNGANAGNEDGTRFLMQAGATIDLSGWTSIVLPMSYHQVTGTLYAAQLADSPVQQDGALYRKEITVDRRYGTNVANWQSFDNLSEGTLEQFLTNGGSLTMDIGDDFIMMSGSVIDVSGGYTTYESGYVYTTLLRKLDGTVIDIREADPDEVYMGLANEWVVYDSKWGKQTAYYIPLMSSSLGKYETTYVQGGEGGSVSILAPDVLLQGTLKGQTVAGRYQQDNVPTGGSFVLNNGGESENEYISNYVLIAATEATLSGDFDIGSMLSDYFGDLFGEEFNPDEDPVSTDIRHYDNTTLTSADFFNRSTMGSYSISQTGRIDPDQKIGNYFAPLDGDAVLVEEGAVLNLANGASLTLEAGQRMSFLGSVRTEGGNVSLSGMSLKLGENTVIDTHGNWYSDYEVDEPVALSTQPRIDGGNISLTANGDITESGNNGLILPETVVLDASGGGWVDRDGNLTSGKGGNLSILAVLYTDDAFDLGALDNARAYGLGGNGAFNLVINRDIVIGDALPVDENGETASTAYLLSPGFFSNSGFSSISLEANSVSVLDGVQVWATTASLQLIDQTLNNGVPPAYWAASGTDIYHVAEVAYIPPEQRKSGLLAGMDLTFIAGAVNFGSDSLVSTELLGSITVNGNTTVSGTLLAPAGSINLTAGNGYVHLAETGQLLTPGVALVTWHGVDAQGNELIDGTLYDGGSINLYADDITLSQGAVLDVSGASVTFALATLLDDGTVARIPTLMGSDGGSISIYGSYLSINDATYLALAGSEDASGGRFSLTWDAKYTVSSTYDKAVSALATIERYVSRGYLWDKNGKKLTTLYGVDLGGVTYRGTVNFGFTDGFVLNSKEEALALFAAIDTAAAGVPPMMIVGESGSVEYTPVETPEVEPGLLALFQRYGYSLPTFNSGDPVVVYLSTDKIAGGGFSSLNISSDLGVIFSGKANLGGTKEDGSYVYDTITINAGKIMGMEGTDATLEAGVVTLNSTTKGSDSYYAALEGYGVSSATENSTIDITGGTLLQIGSASFVGFDTTYLNSGGDIRFAGKSVSNSHPTGSLSATGKLVMKADQIYAGTGRIFTVSSDTGIEILAQDDGGEINGSPYEAGAELTITAPYIIQGGTLRSPIGTLTLEVYDNGTEGSNRIILTNGSITSVSAEGKTIPYGYTSNGDSWIDPFTGLELDSLPTATLTLTGDLIDLQEGATLDVTGGGDLYAREFVSGTGGTYDWLTGYRDQNYDWVSDSTGIYAVIPGYEGNIAPLGFSNSSIGVGDTIYLSGGSGLEAGYYVLLPAEYAMLEGAYRVTVNHHYNGYGTMVLGQSATMQDGSSVQAGYTVSGASGASDPLVSGYLVMPKETLLTRSYYIETFANTFFTSDEYLEKALRENLAVSEAPRVPLDGGSVVLRPGSILTLNGTLLSGAGEGGRGGFADIDSDKVVVAGANTDLDLYNGYLVLDSDQLNDFGAESLLIGGVRKQGDVDLELTVSGTDIIVDNSGSILSAPEILLASTGNIDIKSGSKLETSGQISGSSGDLRIVTAYNKLVDNKGTSSTSDDVTVHEALDQGVVVRISSDELVDILRNADSVNNMKDLLADADELAAVNAYRQSLGYDPIVAGGLLTVEDGASIVSSQSVALDATNDTVVGIAAELDTKQLSASASVVSLGAVPDGTAGLIFSGNSLDVLAQVQDLVLKSYSSIDIYGDVNVGAANSLTLDAGEIRVIDAGSGTVTIAAGTLTLENSNGAEAIATTGDATLTLNAANVRIQGEDKVVSGAGTVNINAAERIIGDGDGTLYLPGDLMIDAGGIATESGQRLFFDADGDIVVAYNNNASLPEFESYGGTLGLTGDAVSFAGHIHMTGGIISLEARTGDVVLEENAVLDVTSDVATFFDESVGVSAGSINLIADIGDVVLSQGSLVDVSGTSVGGNGGTLTILAGLGQAYLNGTLAGDAEDGYSSGSFSLLTATMDDFAAFNSALDTAGFRESRRFEVNNGDIDVSGTVEVQNLTVVANDGSVTVSGTVQTVGDSGGTIQLSASENVTLAAGGKLIAAATAHDGSGGTVLLSTMGRNGGTVSTAAGSLIDVSGSGEGGRLVRFRAPQIGNDIAIANLNGDIEGARTTQAEGYRVYEDVSSIDQTVIDTVSADAIAFMDANAATIQSRLGSGVTLVAGIELRSAGDIELTTDWDLAGLRFNGAPGVLTLRAAGDILINADLSDGFINGSLMDGESWSYNFTAGANIASPDTMAVLTGGLLAEGKGSVLIGGTADTIEYFYDPDYGNDTRLYLIDENGVFLRTSGSNYHVGYVELERDAATGKYIDPVTGELIEKNPVTGEYADTGYYAKRPLPWVYIVAGGGYAQEAQDGSVGYLYDPGTAELRNYIQWDNSTGYAVRTGTGSINIAAGRDLVLEQRPSVIYTAGRNTSTLDGFYVPTTAQYGVDGGDITMSIAGDIIASSKSPQLPTGYLLHAGSVDSVTGLFATTSSRDFDQTTWWVDYGAFEGGIGALGGGNITITAGGDASNIAIAIPNSLRVTGGTQTGEALVENYTGGGDLTLKVGGNLYGGVFYVADGLGEITVGGSIEAGSTVSYATMTGAGCSSSSCSNIHFYAPAVDKEYDLYAMFFTSSGQFDIKSGGDLNIEGVMDPLLWEASYVSFTGATGVSLFSAGGDVSLWNNSKNVDLAYKSSETSPLFYYGATDGFYLGSDSIGADLRPSQMTVVAAMGNVNILSDILMLPSATGNLTVLAGDSIYIGYGTRAYDAYEYYLNVWSRQDTNNYRGEGEGIYMSQADMDLIRTPTNLGISSGVSSVHFRNAGAGSTYPGITPFTIDNLPDLHIGDTEPARIYAANGNIITSTAAAVNLPKQLWVQAGGNIYFPSYTIQHNNTGDLSIVRAGEGIYFATNSGTGYYGYSDSFGRIAVSGPGRLEIEAGTDIYIPSNSDGITSDRIQIYGYAGAPNQNPSDLKDWKPDEDAADIAISTGYSQTPSYTAFEDAYFNPANAAGMEDYLLDEETGLSIYLFDREYERAEGANGEYATPEAREGLVNYVRRLQGLEPLETKTEQLAYLEQAWAYWQALSTDYKTPFYRSVLFLELRTTGREANDRDSERYQTSARGYKAIATLYPGAEKSAGEALEEGESRWDGDFETYASRVVSFGGGDIEFVIPGGSLTMANIAASASETGQPTSSNKRGDALRAGILTTDGGEVNVFANGSVTLNQSRLLTTKGGNVLVWSSYGDIAAGKGAKTAISQQFFDYDLSNYAQLHRTPAGLPTGAGIGTLATQEGVVPADVDLIAPNGIVDAGDAGIRVSGNFNVFAVKILGTDNIDVGGVTTGLPEAPAAPPTSLDVGDAAAKNSAVDKALQDATRGVRRNNSILSPSLIEVRVTGYGECEKDAGGQCIAGQQPSSMSAPQASGQESRKYAALTPVNYHIPSQPLDDAIRAVGQAANINILYDAALLENRVAVALEGSMTPEDALERLLKGSGIIAVRVGPRTIMLKKQ